MIRGSHLAAVTAMTLFAAACLSDKTSTPGVTSPSGGPSSRQTTTTEATPLAMSIFPNEVVGGSGSATARVDVDSAVACCDRTMRVTSNNPSVMSVLSTGTTVSAGATFAAVQLLPATVSQQTVVTIFVTGNGVTVSANLIVDPPGTPPPPPTLSSFTVTPTTVNAGTTATGTVTIPNAAPSGGLVVSLSSRLPASASVPSSVTVPQGATSVSFPVTTFVGFPNSTNEVRIDASNVNTVLESFVDVVTGNTTTTSPTLYSLTLGSTSVAGGTSTTGTVALTAAAPSGGAVVSLSSANTGVATTPSNVTVPAGAFSASFAIATRAVTSSTTLNISASYAGTSLSTPLTVNPSSTTTTLAAPTLLTPSADQKFARGSNITFDWSDATNATSYTIQIDDKDTFPSPLIVNQTVTSSQFSTNTLPTSTMFWRVRANSSSGTAGAWSAARRFEIK
jgi:hypothetical protein